MLRCRYADQLAPFLALGCDLRRPLPGALFRLPLRTPAQAAASRISQAPYPPAKARL